MEIKAELIKPYSEDERISFIVEQNHNKGYEVREVEEGLQAWGYTDEEKQAQELERVSNLKMTSLDLIGYLRQTGLTLKEINNFLDENLELKTQLTYCQNCYCGVVASICPLVIGEIIIDKMQVIEWFKDKNHYIEPIEENLDANIIDHEIEYWGKYEDTTDTNDIPVQFTSENTLEEGETTDCN